MDASLSLNPSTGLFLNRLYNREPAGTRSRELASAVYGLAACDLWDEMERSTAFSPTWYSPNVARVLRVDLGSRMSVMTDLPDETATIGPPTKEVFARYFRSAQLYSQATACINANSAIEAAHDVQVRHTERNRILAQRYANTRRENLLTKYLDRLDEAAEIDSALDRAVLSQVRQTWQGLRRIFGTSLRVPLASPAADGSFLLTWRHGTDYLELEFETDGTRGFFYQDEGVSREEADWEERALWYAEASPGDPMPSDCWDKFRLFVITR